MVLRDNKLLILIALITGLVEKDTEIISYQLSLKKVALVETRADTKTNCLMRNANVAFKLITTVCKRLIKIFQG